MQAETAGDDKTGFPGRRICLMPHIHHLHEGTVTLALASTLGVGSVPTFLRGVHTPLPGAPEWSLGAGAMANDPRDRQLTNAKLDFVKPKEGPQAVRDLAIMRPVLVATRDIAAGEEIFWSYGSATPFEHLRKQQLELQSRKRRREICRFTWVPHE